MGITYTGRRTGNNFANTEYAADFYQPHIPYCHTPLKLAELGIIFDIGDEGNYLPDRDPEQLLKVQIAVRSRPGRHRRLPSQNRRQLYWPHAGRRPVT